MGKLNCSDNFRVFLEPSWLSKKPLVKALFIQRIPLSLMRPWCACFEGWKGHINSSLGSAEHLSPGPLLLQANVNHCGSHLELLKEPQRKLCIGDMFSKAHNKQPASKLVLTQVYTSSGRSQRPLATQAQASCQDLAFWKNVWKRATSSYHLHENHV